MFENLERRVEEPKERAGYRIIGWYLEQNKKGLFSYAIGNDKEHMICVKIDKINGVLSQFPDGICEGIAIEREKWRYF